MALGTVADIVPLTGENRILVRHGLARLTQTASVGLRALKTVAGVSDTCHTYQVGFMLGPRLNAAGRLGSAQRALDLLMTRDPAEARTIADELDAANNDRKRVENRIRDEAEQEIGERFDENIHFGLVAGREGWHIGAIGIVASRLCSRFGRPAIVVGFDENGLGRGSCRSIESLDLVSVLQACEDLLESFGGHRMAAGLTVRRDNFDAFKERFRGLGYLGEEGAAMESAVNGDVQLVNPEGFEPDTEFSVEEDG